MLYRKKNEVVFFNFFFIIRSVTRVKYIVYINIMSLVDMYNLYLINFYLCNKFYFELINCFFLEFCSKFCLFNSEYILFCFLLLLRRLLYVCCGGVRFKGFTEFCFFVCIFDSLFKLKVSYYFFLVGVFSEGRDWEFY